MDWRKSAHCLLDAGEVTGDGVLGLIGVGPLPAQPALFADGIENADAECMEAGTDGRRLAVHADAAVGVPGEFEGGADGVKRGRQRGSCTAMCRKRARSGSVTAATIAARISARIWSRPGRRRKIRAEGWWLWDRVRCPSCVTPFCMQHLAPWRGS